jgi:hypothetical protein
MRNLKFNPVTPLIECCVGTRNNGPLDVDLRSETQSAIRFQVDPSRCPPSLKDVDQQQDWQSQAETGSAMRTNSDFIA